MMIKALVSDLSRVLIFPKEEHPESLNELYQDRTAGGEKFNEIFSFNTPLLGIYTAISHDTPVYVYTSGIYIPTDEQVQTVLSGFATKVFVGDDVPHKKSQPQAYAFLAETLEIKPEELVFVDDSAKNIAAADSAGYQTIHYQDPDQVKQKLQSLGVIDES